ncbi:hypothetical protein ELE36_14410 [Pseudolysobacter antarcticus]|uniref:Uncharacterized protein n=1 Tax=Pseudolysobacter antarcticus TaxID=2511995 RepID=A0A411HM15_9GAMM|nr:hypothetical protein [Pseudolysobacter antarcticus]QBB71454.1 hypothetical protein ELE36_14410 [Pseudolysobacter antarcticus]
MKFTRSRFYPFAAIAFGLLVVVPVQAGDGVGTGLRFNSAAVLDLAERTQKIGGTAIPRIALTQADADAILAASAISEETPPLDFSDDLYGCKMPSKTCSQQHEKKLIEVAGSTVKRDGKYLTITSPSGAVASFVDWTHAGTQTADGDEETHWYLGHLDGSNYHRIEVQFGHDAPGDFLVNPQSGKVAFVHNGSDVAALAPDGKQLLTFNTLNPPLSIRIAALDSSGPRVVLQCEASKGGDNVTARFKGWHDARSFDLAIEIRAARSKLVQKIAARITQSDAGWNIATTNPEPLETTGFACVATAPVTP